MKAETVEQKKLELERPEEPEAFRAESAVIRPQAIEPALIGARVAESFGACRHCGAQILRKEARYCWNCGSDVRPKRLRMADVLKGMTGYATNEEYEALTYAIKALEEMEHD